MNEKENQKEKEAREREREEKRFLIIALGVYRGWVYIADKPSTK